MKLTIITINWNNAEGLRKTMKSVALQTYKDFDYLVIDGDSNDGSKEIMREYESRIQHYNWISEKDEGIYNAMNKGIRIAKGEYVQFLNSGDSLANKNVLGQIIPVLEKQPNVAILYGIEKQIFPNGKIIKSRELSPSLLTFYRGTIPHSAAYIRRDLFEKYGCYDESLKIVSDWKWYLQSIVLGDEIPFFIPIEITDFDKQGISSTNIDLDKIEREQVLQNLLPQHILDDYRKWSFPISQLERVRKYTILDKLFYLCERCLFKFEKWKNRF